LSSTPSAAAASPPATSPPLVGVAKNTLYAWKRKFETDGPAGLVDGPRGAPAGSRLPEATPRAILMLTADNPGDKRARIELSATLSGSR
jgi:hypothetical protein